MKQTHCLLLILFFFNSCNGQITKSDLQTSVDAGIDPYFIESIDTISPYGPNHITRDVLQDRNGNLWFATWLGIIKYDGKLFTNYTLKENLIQFHVVSVFEDKKRNLWFGTARGGLYRYDGISFTLFTTKDGLADNTVTAFAEDNEGNIWFGTDNGASRYDGKAFTNFTMKDGLISNSVSAIIQDKNGKLWFGCRPGNYMSNDGGISCYNTSTPLSTSGKTFTAFTNKDGSPFKNITSLLEDKNGNIWIGQFDGLTVFNPSTKSYTDLLTDHLTYYMIDDQEGNIWLTHSEPNPYNSNIPNQVLYRYDVSTNSFTMIIEKNGPNDFQIFGKTEDKDGNIWFGTMHGPCRYDGKSFTYFTK